MDFIIEEMDKLNADGVDFVPIWCGKEPAPIIESYTREEMIVAKYIPKTNRKYWKMKDGRKEYCDKNN